MKRSIIPVQSSRTGGAFGIAARRLQGEQHGRRAANLVGSLPAFLAPVLPNAVPTESASAAFLAPVLPSVVLARAATALGLLRPRHPRYVLSGGKRSRFTYDQRVRIDSFVSNRSR